MRISSTTSPSSHTIVRTMILVFAIAAAAMAQLYFAPTHPGANTPGKPILGVLNGGLENTINQISIENDTVPFVGISKVWVEIQGLGVEGSWYLQFGDGELGNYAFIGLIGEIREQQGSSLELFDGNIFYPHDRFDVNVKVFSARDWPNVGGDIGGDPNDMTYLKNTANAKDTIDVRLSLSWYGYDSKGDPVAGDTISKIVGIEYNRGQLIPGLSLKGKSKSRLQAIAGGWKVPGEGQWLLRTSDGRQVPLRQRRESSGTVLEPQVPFRGLGILTDSKGWSQPVFASP